MPDELTAKSELKPWSDWKFHILSTELVTACRDHQDGGEQTSFYFAEETEALRGTDVAPVTI